MHLTIRQLACGLLFICVLVLGVVVRDPQVAGASGIGAETKLRFAVFAITAVFVFLVVSRVGAPKGFSIPRTFSVVFLYGAVAVISAAYSVAPMNTVAQGFVLWVFIGLALLVGNYCRDEEGILPWKVLLAALYAKTWVSLLMPLVGIRWAVFGEQTAITVRRMFGFSRLGGVMGAPNAMGFTAALAVLLSFVVLRESKSLTVRSRWLIRLSAGASLGALLWSQSRTAMFGLLMSGILVVGIRNRKRAVLMAVALIVVSVVVWSFNPEATFALVTRGEERTQSLTTLQGRTVIWGYVLSLVRSKPWLGYGYGASKIVLPAQWSLSRFHAVKQAHNVMMESLLTLGVVGAVIVGMVLWRGVVCVRRRLVERGKHPTAGDIANWAVVWLAVIAGISEPSVAYAQSVLTLSFLVAFALAARGGRRGTTTAGKVSREVR